MKRTISELKALWRVLAALMLAIVMRRKRTVQTLAALMLAIGLIAGAVAMAGAQDVTTWATPVPETPGSIPSELAAIIIPLVIAIILAVLAAR